MATYDAKMDIVRTRINDYNRAEFDAKGIHRGTHYTSIGATSGITTCEEGYLNQILDSFEHSGDKELQDFATKKREYMKRLKNDSENAKNIAADIKHAQNNYNAAKKEYKEISSPGLFARIFSGAKRGTDNQIKDAEDKMRYYENVLNAYKITTVSYNTILKHNGMGDFGE